MNRAAGREGVRAPPASGIPPLLMGHPLFAGLPAEAVVQIAAQGRSQRYAAGQSVRLAPGRILLVLAGQIRETAYNASGRVLILRDVGAGGQVGLECAFRRGTTAPPSLGELQAVAETSALICSTTLLREQMRACPDLGERVLEALSSSVWDARRRLEELAFLPVKERLLAELCRLASASGPDGGWLAWIPTHMSLAAQIGTSRETVTRTLAALIAEQTLVRAQTGFRLVLQSQPDHAMTPFD